jgi:methyl-accepting chemotaxis protein
MAKSQWTMPTDEQLSSLYKVVLNVAQQFKSKSSSWKKITVPILAFCIVAMGALLATLVYFVLSQRMGPLLIVVAALIPILCFGLAQSSRTIDKLRTEFEEYHEATLKLVELLNGVGEASEEQVDTLVKAIQSLNKESDDVSTLLNGLSNDTEGLSSDISNLSEQAQTLYKKVVDSLTEDTSTDATTQSTIETASQSTTTTDSSSSSTLDQTSTHIITEENGATEEDLTLIV